MLYMLRGYFSFFVFCLFVFNTSLLYAQFSHDTISTKPLALVIGNSDYGYKKLKHIVNNAKEVANILQKIGFEVIYKTNLNNKWEMEELIDKFFSLKLNVIHNKSVKLFYFAGHSAVEKIRTIDGITEEFFLLPTNNVHIRKVKHLQWYAVRMATILEEIKSSKNKTNIIILDTCYDQPYPNSNIREGFNCGINSFSLPNGSILLSATHQVKKISNTRRNKYKHNLFTKYLLKELETAEQNKTRIIDVFKKVRNLIIKKSHGKQKPLYQSSLQEPFCFWECKPGEFKFELVPERPKPSPPKIKEKEQKFKLHITTNIEGTRLIIWKKSEGTIILERWIRNRNTSEELPLGVYIVQIEKGGHTSFEEEINLQGTQTVEAYLGIVISPW